MIFEHYAADGNRLVNELALELRCGRKRAFRIFRTILQALRDRLPPDDAIEFAQGLPMALKGVFIDQYDISKTPVIIRRADDFLNFIYLKAGKRAYIDFPDKDAIRKSLSAVFFILENHMDYGQIFNVKNLLNREIVEMIEEY